ncbi:MAG: hypothetical protein Q9192_002375 [Flavoplaca navasiana]
MKLSPYSASQTSVSKRSMLHHQPAAVLAVADDKSNHEPRDLDSSPANAAKRAEIYARKNVLCQRNLPRDAPTINPFAQTAVFEARPPLITPTSSLVCNEDNELRGFMRFPDEAHSFCPLFFRANPPHGRALETILVNLPTAQISSACLCFESKFSTGCCPLAAATEQDPLKALVQSVLKSTKTSGRGRAEPAPTPRDPATEDATFARPTEHWGPMTSEVTLTAEWLGPTSILGFSESSTPPVTILSTDTPTLTSSLSTTRTSAAKAEDVVGDASLWLGGGDVLAPGVIAVIVNLPQLHPTQQR